MSFVVFGKPNCPNCNQAKQLLEYYNKQYTYIDLTLDEKRLQQFKEQGFRTVPIIYNDDNLIGGFNELQEHLMESLV